MIEFGFIGLNVRPHYGLTLSKDCIPCVLHLSNDSFVIVVIGYDGGGWRGNRHSLVFLVEIIPNASNCRDADKNINGLFVHDG